MVGFSADCPMVATDLLNKVLPGGEPLHRPMDAGGPL
jgi:hypothetical protein